MNFFQYWPQFFSGTLVTIELMAAGLLLGLLLALILTIFAESSLKLLKLPINVFVFIIRGTPLLVQNFIIYYGSGQFHWLKETILWSVLKQPFSCAVIALVLNTSAYTYVLLQGAIRSVPRGQTEAAYALGLSMWQTYRRIIIPHAIRVVLPVYSNEAIMILKGTSLAGTITLMDLMGMTRHLIAMTYEVIPLFLIAGIIYFILNTLIMGIFYFLEKKLAYQF